MTQANSSKVARLKTVGITLPINLVQKARKYGLNISFIARKALLAEIQRIEGENVDGRLKGASNSQAWWAGRDLNSRPSGYQPDAPTRLSYRPSGIRLQHKMTYLGNNIKFSRGPVAKSGLRRRPPEPESRGSNPLGPAM